MFLDYKLHMGDIQYRHSTLRTTFFFLHLVRLRGGLCILLHRSFIHDMNIDILWFARSLVIGVPFILHLLTCVRVIWKDFLYT